MRNGENSVNSTEIPSWLSQAMTDERTTDICLNGTGYAFADRGEGLQLLQGSMEKLWNEDEMRSWVLAQVSAAGKTWDARYPFIDATLPSGHRLHVAFPPLARQGILVSLRRLPRFSSDHDPAQCAAARRARWQGSPLYEKLAHGVRSGESLLISGATGAGKTTLASDLLEEISPEERILALEDTPELAPVHPHFISLTSRAPNADGFGEVTLRALLRQALRMRPDRIILGECRGAEVMDLLQALNTGHRGSLATLHANSPRDALRRVELLCLLSSSGAVPLSAIRDLLAVGVQWIAQVKRIGSQRKITEVWRLDGREGDTLLLRPILE
jgi:pilus assembly protein CpaF